MRNTTKLKIALLIFAIVVFTLIVLPNAVNAATGTHTVANANELKDEIASANAYDTIKLTDNITLNENISIDKYLVIDGDGHTISGSGTWKKADSLFTVTEKGIVEFENITLTKAPKYGVQAFEGLAVFTNVTIKDCTYGGILVNGGNVVVESLHLGYNGEKSNNGIELDQNSSKTPPTLAINGTLTSSESKDVVRASTNAKTKEFVISNGPETKTTAFVSNGKIIIADENGNVISESVIGEGIKAKVQYQEGITERVLLTIVTKNGTVDVALDKGSTVTSDFVKEHLTLAKGDVIDGYYTDKEYSIAFNFDTVINTDTSIYVKVSTPSTPSIDAEKESVEADEEEKDDTPKTGAIDMIAYASLLAMISIAGIVTLKRK